jgi:hypothetical protein
MHRLLVGQVVRRRRSYETISRIDRSRFSECGERGAAMGEADAARVGNLPCEWNVRRSDAVLACCVR